MSYKECTYADAVAMIGNRILCNNIHEIDPYACESMSDNYYNYYDDDEPNHDGCSDDYEYPEIFQYFLTDCDRSQAEWLERKYNLLFMYSEKMDNYVLCVPHYGTAWSGVNWTKWVDEE